MKMTHKHLTEHGGCENPDHEPARDPRRDKWVENILDALQNAETDIIERLTPKLGGKLLPAEHALFVHIWKAATSRQDFPFAKAIKQYLYKLKPEPIVERELEESEPSAKRSNNKNQTGSQSGEGAEPMSKKNAKVAAVETKPTRKTVATPIAPVTKKAAAEPKAKEATGRFLLFDQPVTAVLRALGKAGCTFEQVRPVLTKKKCDVADATIRIQLTAGKKGERGEPAKLSKVQIAEFKN